jgi:hypothetical protein
VLSKPTRLTSVAAPTTAPRVTLQRCKPVVRLLTARLLLLRHPRLRRQIQPRPWLLHITLLRLQLQLLELLVRVVVLLPLCLHTSIPNRLLYRIPTDNSPATCRRPILLLSLRPHTIIE